MRRNAVARGVPGRNPAPGETHLKRKAVFLFPAVAAFAVAAISSAAQVPESCGRPRLGMQRVVLVATHLLAPRLAKCAAVFRSCPMHTAEHTPSTLTAADSGVVGRVPSQLAGSRGFCTVRFQSSPKKRFLTASSTGRSGPTKSESGCRLGSFAMSGMARARRASASDPVAR